MQLGTLPAVPARLGAAVRRAGGVLQHVRGATSGGFCAQRLVRRCAASVRRHRLWQDAQHAGTQQRYRQRAFGGWRRAAGIGWRHSASHLTDSAGTALARSLPLASLACTALVVAVCLSIPPARVLQSKAPDTVLTVKCLEVSGPRVRDLQHADCRGSPDGGGCKVLDDGSQVVVRHITDKSLAIDTEVRSVPQALAAVRVALQSRAVRPTRCAPCTVTYRVSAGRQAGRHVRGA